MARLKLSTKRVLDPDDVFDDGDLPREFLFQRGGGLFWYWLVDDNLVALSGELELLGRFNPASLARQYCFRRVLGPGGRAVRRPPNVQDGMSVKHSYAEPLDGARRPSWEVDRGGSGRKKGAARGLLSVFECVYVRLGLDDLTKNEERALDAWLVSNRVGQVSAFSRARPEHIKKALLTRHAMDFFRDGNPDGKVGEVGIALMKSVGLGHGFDVTYAEDDEIQAMWERVRGAFERTSHGIQGVWWKPGEDPWKSHKIQDRFEFR